MKPAEQWLWEYGFEPTYPDGRSNPKYADILEMVKSAQDDARALNADGKTEQPVNTAYNRASVLADVVSRLRKILGETEAEEKAALAAALECEVREVRSRSVQRREAIQRGEPMPAFGPCTDFETVDGVDYCTVSAAPTTSGAEQAQRWAELLALGYSKGPTVKIGGPPNKCMHGVDLTEPGAWCDHCAVKLGMKKP